MGDLIYRHKKEKDHLKQTMQIPIECNADKNFNGDCFMKIRNKCYKILLNSTCTYSNHISGL